MQEQVSVLVVEDNATIQKMVELFARRFGVKTVQAYDCRQAMQLISENAAQFAAVLMDWTLPEEDGLGCTRFIRQMEIGTGAHIPIIAMTGNLMPGDREECLAAGMDDFLGKPFSLAEFHAMLDKWVFPSQAIPPAVQLTPAEPVGRTPEVPIILPPPVPPQALPPSALSQEATPPGDRQVGS